MNAKSISYSTGQLNFLVILRMLIGWHFLYEGMVKLWNPGWSARSYLLDSQGWFSQFFYDMAGNDAVMNVVDPLNVWGLILVGLGLITGLFSRWAAIGGMVLLTFYYLSHPAIIGVKYALPSEGSYLFVNKNLIEIFALGVLVVFPTSHIVGLDRLVARLLNRNTSEEPISSQRLAEKEKVSI